MSSSSSKVVLEVATLAGSIVLAADSTTSSEGETSRDVEENKYVFIYDIRDITLCDVDKSREYVKRLRMMRRQCEQCRIAEKPTVKKELEDRWEISEKCIKLARSRTSQTDKYFNLVISSQEIVTASMHLAASSLLQSIPRDNIYSTYFFSNTSVFSSMRRRFGEDFKYVIISSDQRLIRTAVLHDITSWSVYCQHDFEDLYSTMCEDWIRPKETKNDALN